MNERKRIESRFDLKIALIWKYITNSYSATLGAAIHICQLNWALGDGEFFAGIYDDFVAAALTERDFFERWFILFGSFRLNIGPNPRRDEPDENSDN